MSATINRIDIQQANEALRTLTESDLSELIDSLSFFLNRTVDVSVTNDLPELEAPDPEIVELLADKGFIVDAETGDIYQFKNIEYSLEQLNFLADVALAINELNKFIQMVTVQKIVGSLSGVGIMSSGDDHDRQKAQATQLNSQFLELLINLWTNFTFTYNNKPVNRGKVINQILVEILTSANSPFKRWYGKQIDFYLTKVRNGIEAAFSGWLAVKNSSKNPVRLPTSEEDINGADIVSIREGDGQVIRYYQIKTLSYTDTDTNLYQFNSAPDGSAPQELYNFIYENFADKPDDQERMMKGIQILVAYAWKSKKPWSWIFITRNYFMDK